MDKLCAICQKSYSPRRPTDMFCYDCYTKYKEAILNKVPWAQYCVASESARRKWDSYIKNNKRVYVGLVYLGNQYDIALAENGKGKLIPTDFKEVN